MNTKQLTAAQRPSLRIEHWLAQQPWLGRRMLPPIDQGVLQCWILPQVVRCLSRNLREVGIINLIETPRFNDRDGMMLGQATGDS